MPRLVLAVRGWCRLFRIGGAGYFGDAMLLFIAEWLWSDALPSLVNRLSQGGLGLARMQHLL